MFDDFRAQIGAPDDADVGLHALAIDVVLVEHVGRARLDLGGEDALPEYHGRDLLARLALLLVSRVELVEFVAVDVAQPGAFVWTEQTPVAAGGHPLHEQVGDPQRVEQIPGPTLLLAVVLAQLQELLNVRVPGFDVHGEAALPLASPLVHVAGNVVEDAQHGHDSVAVAVGALDVRLGGSDLGDVQPDAACELGDQRALLHRVKDAVYGVLLHGEQEAGTHLAALHAGRKQGRGRVRVVALAQQIVRRPQMFKIQAHHIVVRIATLIILVAFHSEHHLNGHPHPHVLRPLHDVLAQVDEVGAHQGLDPKVVQAKVARVVDQGYYPQVVLPDRGHVVVVQQLGRVHEFGDAPEIPGGGLVQVGDFDARSQGAKGRVVDRLVGQGLARQGIQLGRRHAALETLDDVLGDDCRVDDLQRDGGHHVTQGLDAARDLVKVHRLLPSISLEDKHG